MTRTTPDEPAGPVAAGGGLVRFRLDIGYDGTDFAGWARQRDQRSVQATVEDALATLLRCDEPPALTVAGRTDAGVHARGQVAHVDLPGQTDPQRLLRQLNGVLPDDVRVTDVSEAAAGFDARFSALSRRYTYRVADRVVHPLRRRETLWWPRPLSLPDMQQASARLLGQHDFAAFCRQREGATTIRTLLRLDWAADDDGVLVAAVQADAFCHSMVRSLVGAVLAVGDRRRPVDWPASLLTAQARSSEVQVAPAHGLTLVGVDYPPADQLAARTEVTRQRRSPR